MGHAMGAFLQLARIMGSTATFGAPFYGDVVMGRLAKGPEKAKVRERRARDRKVNCGSIASEWEKEVRGEEVGARLAGTSSVAKPVFNQVYGQSKHNDVYCNKDTCVGLKLGYGARGKDDYDIPNPETFQTEGSYRKALFRTFRFKTETEVSFRAA